VIAAANTEAHDAYLRGRHLVVQRSPAALEGAVREFEKAITLDADYALAHAELAMATTLRIPYGGLTYGEAIARAAPSAERAMALDPSLAEAHAATGFLLWQKQNLEETLTHFEQAIQINPNYSIVYNWMAGVLDSLGRYDEAFLMRETALRLDPLSMPAIYNYTSRLIDRNRLAEADREMEKLVSFAPVSYANLRGIRTSFDGKWANAVLGNLNALRIEPERLTTRNDLTLNLARIGLEKEALAISEHPLPTVLSWLGKPGDTVTTAEARLAEDPMRLTARRHLGVALASAGDYARARPNLEEMWQRTGGRVTTSGLFRIESASALIAIRRDAGEDAEVGELVTAIRDDVRRYREAGIIRVQLDISVDYEEGLAAYLVGERKTGLALIAKSAEDGFFIPQRDAYLQALYDDPGFAPIRASQEARQKREREKFLAVVCNDNPYAAVWQPAEGTCERFAAAGGN
jgi:tetratricopeptide (TPR) repeat protein